MLRESLFKQKWVHFHPTAFQRYEKLKAFEHASLDELLFRQERARREIVRAAMTTTFYPKFYGAAGFEIGDIGKEGWFERLPIVTKEHLREHFDEFVNPALRQFLRVSTTGGSTGTPTKAGYDGRAAEEIYSWRLQNWFDIHPWDDHAYVWRDTRSNKVAQLKNAALWWPTRHLKLDATFMTDEGIAAFLTKCRKVKPALLQGYVGAITQVADFVLRNSGRARSPSAPQGILGNWQPKVVWTTSAPLSPVQRKLIEEAFGAPVCDQYGSCEIRWIAQQCAVCNGLHVNIEHVNIEFVDDGNRPVQKGDYGRTLLTNLEDEVFPLIRYENGDRGRWLTESCSCGRTLPCIDSVKGRESESFVLPSGKVINGEYLTTIFDATPDLVRGFRVIQHKDLSITIEYIPNAEANVDLVGRDHRARRIEACIEDVLRAFASRLGGEVSIDFKSVSEIPHDRGKLRFVLREK